MPSRQPLQPPAPRQSDAAILVCEYKRPREYQRDAQQLATQGYRIVSTTEQRERFAWWQVLVTGGLIYWITPRRTVIVVTYSR